MKFVLTIDLDGAALRHTCKIDCGAQIETGELARILRDAALRVHTHGDMGGTLFDVNGNSVGEFVVQGKGRKNKS